MHFRHVIKSRPILALPLAFLIWVVKPASAVEPCKKCKTIKIEAYGSTDAKVTPDHQLVTCKAKIKWSSIDGNWEVEWKDDNNPCSDLEGGAKKKRWHGDKGGKPDTCQISACDNPNGSPHTYKYTIRVTTEDGKHEADPDVIVDAGRSSLLNPDTQKKSASPDRKK
jgi:hypothetical protein